MTQQVHHGDGAATAGANIHRVRYTFSAKGSPDRFVVTGFEGVEELGRPYRLAIHLTAEDEATDASDLLGRDATFTIDRDDVHHRTFHGVVSRVTVRDDAQARQNAVVEVSPALCALRRSRSTRIFQEKTALDIVLSVLGEELGPYDRTVDASNLDPARFHNRDYCVQYQETAFDFVHRLLEEEGIGYVFAFPDEGPERLVLLDDNRQAVKAPTMNDGAVVFDAAIRNWVGAEPALQFISTTEPAPSQLTVRDHDWTRGRPQLEQSSRNGAAIGDRAPHEVYEHGFGRQVTISEDRGEIDTLLRLAVTAAMPFGMPLHLEEFVHVLPGAILPDFTSSDLDRQSEIRAQLLHRDVRVCQGTSLVTGFSAGSTFELLGHPTLGADGEYLLTKVVHGSALGEHEPLGGEMPAVEESNYQNRFECIPLSTPWRPARTTPKPRIYGVQTARVVGPIGMDVHTDALGRIKVRFPWDRSDPDPAGNYTCWLRVSQIWAGQGAPGFMFIPRVGMEVVVSFVDGNPDRPLVTGCVYNGENPTPGLLPVQATKSILRTRTVPHGIGYNELSFEDAMGMECVHIRAERNLDEHVQNDHKTQVDRCQVNRVGLDQTEEIRRHQRVNVKGDRRQTVHGSHTEDCRDYHLNVDRSANVHVGGHHELSVAQGSAVTTVQFGEYVVKAKRAIELFQNEEQFIEMCSEGETKGIFLDSKGSTVHICEDEIELNVKGSTITISEDKIELKIKGSVITMTESAVQVNQKTFPASGGGGGGSGGGGGGGGTPGAGNQW